TFSEAVTGFDNTSVTVTGGTLSTITQVNGATYTAVFTPAAGVEGQRAGRVGVGGGKDGGGSPGGGGSSLWTAECNNVPTVTAAGSSPTLKAGQTDTITFTFSEAVTGFDNTSVSVTGGTLSTITKVDDTHYTAVFTPAAGADTQTATIQVVASG